MAKYRIYIHKRQPRILYTRQNRRWRYGERQRERERESKSKCGACKQPFESNKIISERALRVYDNTQKYKYKEMERNSDDDDGDEKGMSWKN